MDKDKYIGQLLDDRYEILEVIGVGGMAVVYKALCHRLNRMVAVKILKDEFVQDKEFRERFHGESQAVAMLSHPNIVSVYDVSTSNEADYIVMELIDGISLKQYMQRKGVLNWKETLHFAIQIAKALEHAHSRGIVHRDIKPHNVMILKNGSVKVADFGIAQITATPNTLTTEALGSVHYISPEQAKGGRVDNRSDIYSLGVVMYEMIAGRVPYDGDTPVNIAIQHINGGAQKPSQYNPNVPKGLEQIIRKAMALQPKDRYPTATPMLYDMDEFRKNPTMETQPEADRADGIPVISVNTPKEPKTLARQKSGEIKKAEPERRRRRAKDDEAEFEEEGRSYVTTIAIASCVVVAIVAIIVFFVVLGPTLFAEEPQTVTIPNLVGERYELLGEYGGIEVVKLSEEYNNEYPRGEIIYQHPLAGETKVFGTKLYVKISKGPVPVMQNLVGRTFGDAQKYIYSLGFGLKVNLQEENHDTALAGTVFRTEPAEGANLTEGQTITVWVSLGPKMAYKDMINVVGLTYEEALQELNQIGFSNITPNYVKSDRPRGEVVGQSVREQENINVTKHIILNVSQGSAEDPTEPPEEPLPEPVTLEHVFDVAKLEESYVLGIKLGEEWIVESMIIEPGTTTVTLTLSGNGIQNYDLYIDGVYFVTETVDFDGND